MLTADEILDKINACLDRLPDGRQPQTLYEPVRYVLSMGGKRIRPVLMMLGYNLFKDDPESILPQATALETYHNYTLLHDDLMDNADVRRGLPTVHVRWSANTAILSGDAMLTMSSQLMSQCDDRHLRAVLETFNSSAMLVYEGQQLDMDFEERNDVTVGEYIDMIRLKTSVLLGCALKIGAILADANEDDTRMLYEYGINLGLGFQLRDDYLDTFGDPLIFGKEIGGDIINDKKTWLMISACQRDTGHTMRHALEGRYDDETKIRRVTEVYRELGLDTEILELIRQYSDHAVKCLEKTNMAPAWRQYFTRLAEDMINRMN